MPKKACLNTEKLIPKRHRLQQLKLNTVRLGCGLCIYTIRGLPKLTLVEHNVFLNCFIRREKRAELNKKRKPFRSFPLNMKSKCSVLGIYCLHMTPSYTASSSCLDSLQCILVQKPKLIVEQLKPQQMLQPNLPINLQDTLHMQLWPRLKVDSMLDLLVEIRYMQASQQRVCSPYKWMRQLNIQSPVPVDLKVTEQLAVRQLYRAASELNVLQDDQR